VVLVGSCPCCAGVPCGREVMSHVRGLLGRRHHFFSARKRALEIPAEDAAQRAFVGVVARKKGVGWKAGRSTGGFGERPGPVWSTAVVFTRPAASKFTSHYRQPRH